MKKLSTTQKFFNKCVRGLAKQRFRKSVDPKTGGCMGLDLKGRRCAIAQMVPKSTLIPGQVGMYTCMDWLWSEGWSVKVSLSDLQGCHDDATSPQDMKRRLKEYARRNGLSIEGLPL